MFSKLKSSKKSWLILSVAILFITPSYANGDAPIASSIDNPLAQMLLIIIAFLALAIGIMVNVMLGAVDVYRAKMQKERESENASAIKVLTTISAVLFCNVLFAQNAPAIAKASDTINGLTMGMFYMLITVIGVEIVILITLTFLLKWMMGIERKKKIVPVKEVTIVAPQLSWWDKLNRSVAMEKEREVDLNHDYDGISELDNPVPPWWKLAFVFTIVFGLSYLYRYHVAYSAPLQTEELQIAMLQADEEKNAYLKNAASKVDENTVAMLGEDGIALGKSLYTINCVACHGSDGQGGVGPNLTDEYWLHQGGIKDVFKSIKYGWADKGMRSWKEDFSATQIAQLASFVKSLQGTKPANGKEPQGDLFKEIAAGADSISLTNK